MLGGARAEEACAAEFRVRYNRGSVMTERTERIDSASKSTIAGPPQNASVPEPQAEMTLFEHLGELRNRLIISVLSVLVCAVVVFFFTPEIIQFLIQPYHNAFPEHALIATGPADAIMVRLKTAVFGGFLIGLPILFHQLWLFVAPGLYEHEKRMVFPFVLSTSALFFFGVAFCFVTIVPVALTFFAEQFQTLEGVTPSVRLEEYLSLVIQFLLAFGVTFELPVIAFLFGRMGVINDRSLIVGARYAIVGIFVLAAVLTPSPDVLSQVLMAGPLLVLYGVSVVIVKYTARDRDVGLKQQ
jgi:sec-independent protein translocase protein TatC